MSPLSSTWQPKADQRTDPELAIDSGNLPDIGVWSSFFSICREDISAGRIVIKQAKSLKNRKKNDIVGDMIFLPFRQVTMPLPWKKVIYDGK